MPRTCRRSDCCQPATVSLTFRYDTAEVRLDELEPEPHPQRWELCETHASVTVPRGWRFLDARGAARPAPASTAAGHRNGAGPTPARLVTTGNGHRADDRTEETAPIDLAAVQAHAQADRPGVSADAAASAAAASGAASTGAASSGPRVHNGSTAATQGVDAATSGAATSGAGSSGARVHNGSPAATQVAGAATSGASTSEAATSGAGTSGAAPRRARPRPRAVPPLGSEQREVVAEVDADTVEVHPARARRLRAPEPAPEPPRVNRYAELGAHLPRLSDEHIDGRRWRD